MNPFKDTAHGKIPRHLGARRAGLLLAALSLLVLSACEEAFFVPEPGTDPQAIFDQVWTFADQEYSFFDYKNVDWDQARVTYGDRLESETADGGIKEQELFDILADMLFELEDGHVNLVSDFDTSRNAQWYLQPEPNYDYSVLQRYYFTSGGTDTVGDRSLQELVGDAFILMDFTDQAQGDVGYIHYRSFSRAVTAEDMDLVIERFSGDSYTGLIIDVRNNGGGSLSNVYAIAERFNSTGSAVPVLETQVKTGPGREDFSEKRRIMVDAPEGVDIYDKPVVVLTNALSYSATNFFAAVMQGLANERPYIHVMGQATGGGGGLPAYTELSNGWELRVSTTRTFMVDPDPANAGDPSIEGRVGQGGVFPDEVVASPENDPAIGLNVGVDNILEQALAHLRQLSP